MTLDSCFLPGIHQESLGVSKVISCFPQGLPLVQTRGPFKHLFLQGPLHPTPVIYCMFASKTCINTGHQCCFGDRWIPCSGLERAFSDFSCFNCEPMLNRAARCSKCLRPGCLMKSGRRGLPPCAVEALWVADLLDHPTILWRSHFCKGHAGSSSTYSGLLYQIFPKNLHVDSK